MKIIQRLRIFTALLVMLMTGIMVQAQTGQEAQKKEQQKQEQQIREMEMQLKKQQLEQEHKMKELERVYTEQARTSSRERASYRSSGWDEGPYMLISHDQENQSQLTLRNSFNGETLTSTGEFDVDESTSHIRFTVNGKVRHGEISIKVLYPGGNVFKDLTLNSSAEITFSQSLTINDDEKKKYVGAWKYEVSTKTAEGNYMLSIMTH